jgi:hypothetical protein
MEEKSFWKSPITIILIVLAVLLCCCIVIAGVGGYYLYQAGREVIANPDEPFTFDDRTPTPLPVTRLPVENVPTDTFAVLEQAIVPVNDPRALAERLGGKDNVPETLPSGPFQVGDEKEFWVTNVDTNESFKIKATLRYAGEHVYFWIENGVRYDEKELKPLTEAFDTKIYPTNREFFGSEWSPGVDGDPRIYVLYASGLGSSLAGYYSSADEVHPLAHEYSNAHEMFLFNSDNTDLGSDFTYGVLAHEFQHMIHWYQDRNEQSWLNEGFSELAAFLNGYDPGGFDWIFTADPDLQLTDWPNDPNATGPHYGAGFLFTTYFLDRFGEEATQALVRHPKNGMDSVDAVLTEFSITDPLTGQPLRADDVFAEWTVANYLNNPKVGDGRFDYELYKSLTEVSETETISDCPDELTGRGVNQYGADYIRITCSGALTLRFEGATQTKLLPAGADAHSGRYAFWSNKGDESNMTLTREFDLSGVSGPATFQFWTWYDLEEDYDYIFLTASTDGGETWQILKTPSGTDEDPSGNSFGWGYNGATNGWVEEKVDIPQFAGQKVLLRFEYVTDAAVNGEGLVLDDVSVPELNYSADFESDDGGWQAEGFARVENILPQTFRVTLILRGAQTTVQFIPVDAGQTAEISLNLGDEYDEAILIVSGTTRFTREDAAYTITIR